MNVGSCDYPFRRVRLYVPELILTDMYIFYSVIPLNVVTSQKSLYTPSVLIEDNLGSLRDLTLFTFVTFSFPGLSVKSSRTTRHCYTV